VSIEALCRLGLRDDVVHRAEQAFGAYVSKRQPPSAPGVPPFRARQHFVTITFVDWRACGSGTVDLPGLELSR
jgi:hypothetical protein